MDNETKGDESDASVATSKPSRARKIPHKFKFLDGEVGLPNAESGAASTSTSSDKVVEPVEAAEGASKLRARAVKIEAPTEAESMKKDEETPKRSAPPTPRAVLTNERPKRGQGQVKKEAPVKNDATVKTAKKTQDRKQSAKSEKPKKAKVEYDLHGTTFLVCERRADHLNSCCFCVDTPRVKKEEKNEMDTDSEKKDEMGEDSTQADKMNGDGTPAGEDSEMAEEKKGDVKGDEVKEEAKNEAKKVKKEKKEEKADEELAQGYTRCSYPKCGQIMHVQCATEFICGEYSPGQAQLLFSTDGPVCPSHFCWHCYEERHKNSSRFGDLVDCEKCMRSFHVECVPAGCKVIGKKHPKARPTFICHHHTSPKEIKKTMRMKYCLECWDYANEEKGELIDCETCTNVFHKKCSYKVVKGPGSEKYNHNICTSCLTGSVIVPGQRVLAYCNVSFKGLKKGNYPGVAVTLNDVPSGLNRDLGPNLGKPGYIVVKWFWQGLETAYYNVIHKSAVQRMIIGCEKNLPDSDFRKELRAEEDNFNAPTRGLDHEAMRKTIKIVTSNVFSSKAPRSTVTKTKEYYACECKEDPITKIKCNTDACLNRGVAMECSKECDAKEGVFCANRGLQRGEGKERKYEVKMAPNDKGFGIFATAAIKPLDFVFEYAGEVLTEDEWKAREGRLSQLRAYDEYTYMMGLTHQLIVDARFKGSLARYANHSCEPNCVVDSIEVPVKVHSGDKCTYEMRLRVQARKPIKSGEEITFAYEMHKSEHLAIDYCYCGAKSCLNKIGKVVKKGDEDVERFVGNKRLYMAEGDEDESSSSDDDSEDSESDDEKENKKMQKKPAKGKGKSKTKPRVSVGTAQKKKEEAAKKKVEEGKKKRRASDAFGSRPSSSRAAAKRSK